jgi:hypothetical protein
VVSICTEQDGFIASNTAEIFEKCLELLLGKWSIGVVKRSGFNYAIRTAFLSRLALPMLVEEKDKLLLDEAVVVAKRFFEQAGLDLGGGELIEDLMQSGVLRFSEGRVEFCTRAFLEFFAARRLGELPDGDDQIVSRMADRGFSQAIVFYAGLRKDCSGLIGKAIDGVPGELLEGEEQLRLATGVEFEQIGDPPAEAAGVEPSEVVRPPQPEEALKRMDEAYESAMEFEERQAKKRTGSGRGMATGQDAVAERGQEAARESVHGKVGYWTVMLGLIARNATLTNEATKEVVVRRVIANMGAQAGVVMKSVAESTPREWREFAKLFGVLYVDAMTLFALGSPALRQAYAAYLAQTPNELEEYLMVSVMSELALPGYIEGLEHYVSRARNVLPLVLLHAKLMDVLDLRDLKQSEKTALEEIIKRVRRKLRSAEAYLHAVFEPLRRQPKGVGK